MNHKTQKSFSTKVTQPLTRITKKLSRKLFGPVGAFLPWFVYLDQHSI